MLSKDFNIGFSLVDSFDLPQLCNSALPKTNQIKQAKLYNPPNRIKT